MIYESLLRQIDRGREKKNQGISTGLNKVDSITDGVMQGTNTLVFSNSGSGKTSFAIFAYIYMPLIKHLDDDKFKIIYFSLEMTSEMLMAKLLAIHLYYEYHVEVSVKELLSRKKGYILSNDLYSLVKESEEWMKKVEKHLFIYDKNVNADTIYAITMQQLEKYGKFSETENKHVYTPYDPDRIVLGVIDHVSLETPAKGRTLKEEIDLTSKYGVSLRNRTNMSWLYIQQTNRDQGNIERFKANKSAFTLNDTKDSGNIVQDCEVVIAIYNPFRDGLKRYNKYDVEQLNNCFRSLLILKNRYGESEVEIPVVFFGKNNIWYELPRSEEIYDYGYYTSSLNLLQSKETRSNEISEMNNTSNLNFIV